MIRTAAAFSRTTSRRGPGSPAKIARRICGVGGGVASTEGFDGRGAQADLLGGEFVAKLMALPRTSASWLGPEMEISSSPL